MLPVAILAGGRASRLRPITESLPKALVPLGGRPFIYWQLELLARQGVSEIVLCVGHLGEQIGAAVGDGRCFGLNARYSMDGERLLGTGGALRRALPMLSENFFVLYGDSFLRCSFAEVQAAYEASGAPALMTVLSNDNRRELCNVLFRGGKIVEYNKRAPRHDMTHIDYGLGVLSGAVLRARPDGTAFDLADLYHELSLRGALAGLEVAHRFYEIGSRRGMEETERYLRTVGEAT